MLTVFFVIAHDGSKNFQGAVTPDGVTENQVTEVAQKEFVRVLTEERPAWDIQVIPGNMNSQIIALQEKIKILEEQQKPWVTVELDFNASPLEDCPNTACTKVVDGQIVRNQKHCGNICPFCGAKPTKKWAWGHTAVVHKDSKNAQMLGCFVLNELSFLMHQSKQLPLILVPNPLNAGGRLVREVSSPCIIVEAGFENDVVFANWIKVEKNQKAYGSSVAMGVIRWFATYLELDMKYWKN